MKLTRRFLLTGHDGTPSPTGFNVADDATYCISSAVLSVLPQRMADVLRQLSQLDGVEVHAARASRIVVVIEGTSSGALGESLVRMSLLDGVIAANMVYEHADVREATRQ